MYVLFLHSQEGRSWAVTMEDLHWFLIKVSLIWQNPVYQMIKFYTMFPEKVESPRTRMGASPSRAAWHCWDKPSCQVMLVAQASIPAVPDCSHPCFDILVKRALWSRFSSHFSCLIGSSAKLFAASLSFSAFCQPRPALQTWDSNFFLAPRQFRNTCAL